MIMDIIYNFNITRFSCCFTVTRRVPLVVLEWLILAEYLSSPTVFSQFRVVKNVLVFWVVFCWPLFVFSHCIVKPKTILLVFVASPLSREWSDMSTCRLLFQWNSTINCFALFNSNTSGAGITYPSGAFEFAYGFQWY